MKMKIPKDMTIPKFINWIKTHTDSEIKVKQKHLEVVVKVDNIEKGKCVPLIAYMDGNQLMIVEFTDDYYKPPDAWQAIENSAPTYSPSPFHDWVKDQYLTSKNIKVERIF